MHELFEFLRRLLAVCFRRLGTITLSLLVSATAYYFRLTMNSTTPNGRSRASYLAPMDAFLDHLLCMICAERFDAVGRRPLLLPCGHTLCKSCTQQLKKNECPQDRRMIQDRQSLPTNFLVLQMVDSYARAQTSTSARPSGGPAAAAGSSCLPGVPRDVRYFPSEHVRLLEQIGSGSAGVVYKAKLPSETSPVAVKMFWANLQTPSSANTGSSRPPVDLLMRHFMQEVEVLVAVTHKTQSCVRLLGCTAMDNRPCIVMQLHQQGHLKVPAGGFIRRQALQWGLAIAKALQEAHQLGVVVADLKPGNILVDDQGRPVLADFGLSRRMNTTLAMGHGNTIWGGTPGYMAPEQCRRGVITNKADSWAWACVMVELLTGQPPWSDLPDTQVMYRQGHSPISPEPPSNIPTGLARLLQACWELPPAKRPSAQEIVARLQNNMSEWSDVPPPRTPRQHNSRIRSHDGGVTSGQHSSSSSTSAAAAAAAGEPAGLQGFWKGLKQVFQRASSGNTAAGNSNSRSNSQPEQIHQGRPLSDWVAQLHSDGSEQEVAAHALATATTHTHTASAGIWRAGGIAALSYLLTSSRNSNIHLFAAHTAGGCSPGRSGSTVAACRWAATALANMLQDERGCALEVLSEGAVPALMDMLYSVDEQSARGAMWALKRLAAADLVCRDALAQLNIVQPATEVLMCSTDDQTRAQAAHLLAELCGCGLSVVLEIKSAGSQSNLQAHLACMASGGAGEQTELQQAARRLLDAL